MEQLFATPTDAHRRRFVRYRAHADYLVGELPSAGRAIGQFSIFSNDSCHPAALVVDAHGAQETAAANAGKEPFFDWPGGLGSGWRLLADREGFIVVQPQGIGNAWDQSDVDFMLQIPAFVGRTAALDTKRVYMTGISNGGALTYWTACRDTGVYRAFSVVAGFADPPCTLTHHTPIIHFHTPTDRLVSLASGKSAFDMLRRANHCAAESRPSWSFGGGSSDQRALCLASTDSGGTDQWRLTACDASSEPTTCDLWDRCDQGSKAMLCTVSPDREHHFDRMGGHVLYFNGTHLSLAGVAWEFFKTN
jgi:polyhydroxybutyrate depolymerase